MNPFDAAYAGQRAGLGGIGSELRKIGRKIDRGARKIRDESTRVLLGQKGYELAKKIKGKVLASPVGQVVVIAVAGMIAGPVAASIANSVASTAVVAGMSQANAAALASAVEIVTKKNIEANIKKSIGREMSAQAQAEILEEYDRYELYLKGLNEQIKSDPSFNDTVAALKTAGLSDDDIATFWAMSDTYKIEAITAVRAMLGDYVRQLVSQYTDVNQQLITDAAIDDITESAIDTVSGQSSTTDVAIIVMLTGLVAHVGF